MSSPLPNERSAKPSFIGDVTLGDLRREELAHITWSGSAAHLRNVGMQLDRRDAGVVEYLVVRDTAGVPIAKGAIDYEETAGAGTMFQLATRSDLEGRGLARQLIAEAERRILGRGLRVARLGVEPDNSRARRLYEWLGYRPVGEREAGWEYEREDGVLDFYRTTIVEMEKTLESATRASDSSIGRGSPPSGTSCESTPRP